MLFKSQFPKKFWDNKVIVAEDGEDVQPHKALHIIRKTT